MPNITGATVQYNASTRSHGRAQGQLLDSEDATTHLLKQDTNQQHQTRKTRSHGRAQGQLLESEDEIVHPRRTAHALEAARAGAAA